MKKLMKIMVGLLVSMILLALPVEVYAAHVMPPSQMYSGDRSYTRVNGPTRYETATNTAAKIMEIRGVTQLDSIVLCSGIKFPDALSGSYLAYTNGAPIVYQNPEGLQDGPTEFILSNVKPGGTVYIMGLEIPTSIEQTFTDAGLEVKRLGGATRIETNLDALQETGVPDDCLFIASAGNFPDAMCASACGIPIMLTYESLKDSQLAFIESLGKKLDIYVAGGPAAVTDQVLGQLEPYASSIKRLSGDTRFTTATAIAEEVFSDVAYNQVVITEGNGYVDGLAASQLAAALGVPMILAANDTKIPAIDFVADHNILNGYFAASWSLLSDETAREIMGIYDTISGTYQDGTYRLRCAANERYTLTMERNSADNGVNLRLERFAGSAQQAFTLSRIDRGIMIAPVVSGKAIDISGGTMAEGTRLLQYQYTNGLNQKWEAVANSDGTFSFRSIKNGNYYITVNDTTAASSQMGIHTWYNDERNAYQKFVLEIVDAKRTMPNGMFLLAAASDHSKVIEVANKSKTNGANIQLGNLGDTNAQKFNLTYLGDGYYQVANVRSSRVIDIQGGNATPGTNVQQYGWDGGNYQRWAFSYNQFGYNICSGLGTVLDCKGGSTAAGTNIQSYRPNDTIAQCFVPIPTQPSYEKSYLVAIDAGHQRTQNRGTEPNGPGSSVMKQKVTSGTHGNWSGLDEYVLNLQVALKLQAELQNRGYDVFMVRTTHDVNISNAERAQMATAAGADIFIRIHANGSDNHSVRGALMYQPSMSNPYLSNAVKSGSQRLSQILLNNYIAATGLPNKGIIYGDDMTGINWATMPVTIVEMGFMSNQQDDLYMASAAGQAAIVRGLANGVDQYFG